MKTKLYKKVSRLYVLLLVRSESRLGNVRALERLIKAEKKLNINQ